MIKRLVLSLVMTFVLAASSLVLAHEKVKLTGYLGDVMCTSGHLKESPEELTKVTAEHEKSCGLMDACVKSGYGIVADGKWYPFDDKGKNLAKWIFEKSAKSDHIKVTVEGMKHDGKILVERITEAE
jgi:hypothetical protein